MSERGLPSFLEVLGPSKGLTPFFMANMLGITLIVTTVIAAQTALSLIFDARWRDFPFAALTMAVVPFWTLAFLNGSKSGERPLSEAVFAGLFAMAAIYVVFNEGFENWQAMWTGAYALGSALWRARTAAVARCDAISTARWLTRTGSPTRPRTISRTMPTVSSIIVSADVEMRAGANAAVHHREQDAALAQGLDHFVAGDASAIRLEEHQIGLGLLHLDAVDLRQPARQRARIGVIVGEAVDVMVERVDAGGCSRCRPAASIRRGAASSARRRR